jgi:hypothetical protein
MDSWDSVPITFSFRQQCRQLLGTFFRSLQHSKPWWVSIAKPINGIEQTCLPYLLGFEQDAGIDFLCMTGSIKHGHSRNQLAAVVVTAERDKFVDEQNLGDLMETINKTSISRTSYYFFRYGKKSKLSHCPIEQFNGRISKPSVDIAALGIHQHSFHKKLSIMVISFHAKQQPVE